MTLTPALPLLRNLLEEVRDSRNGQNGDNPNANALMADAMALLSVGETWGAVANLLVAWELAHDNDEDEASPLLSLAGLANSQGLPHVALALLEAADKAKVDAKVIADDTPAESYGVRVNGQSKPIALTP